MKIQKKLIVGILAGSLMMVGGQAMAGQHGKHHHSKPVVYGAPWIPQAVKHSKHHGKHHEKHHNRHSHKHARHDKGKQRSGPHVKHKGIHQQHAGKQNRPMLGQNRHPHRRH